MLIKARFPYPSTYNSSGNICSLRVYKIKDIVIVRHHSFECEVSGRILLLLNIVIIHRSTATNLGTTSFNTETSPPISPIKSDMIGIKPYFI